MSTTMELLKKDFLYPPDEFTPLPFWFWNGNLREDEIQRQIRDFRRKGIMGFVIHPRMGIPREIEYLSSRFLSLVRFAVSEAARLGMKVVLYDEAMYPSGSAHGLVIKDNPEYASRGLKMSEYPMDERSIVDIPVRKEEEIVSILAVQKTAASSYLLSSTQKLFMDKGKVEFHPPNPKDWSILVFSMCFSKGTIRGIHFGEDDGEPMAPPSADLLNDKAMQKFIAITHEKYYEMLKSYFGNTIIAFFTDEPAILGRHHTKGLIPWTADFLRWYVELGNEEKNLPALFIEANEKTDEIRREYRRAVNLKLGESYYRPIALWCAEHHIAMAGHPEKSDDIALLQYFHIPGQDIVWRWVAPEDGKALEGEHSTVAKCSSDAARHSGRRRNGNECFGCCGPDGIHWAFSADDMKWYLDWLFVRGVNLLYPHAFYYSVEGEKRFGERPPDVGPNNIWWKYYSFLAAYMKRMCWLMTDSVNQARIAVLCGEEGLPWKSVKILYQHQLEFNYLEQRILLSEACEVKDETLTVKNQSYHIVIVEDTVLLTEEVIKKLSGLLNADRKVIIYKTDKQEDKFLNYHCVHTEVGLAEAVSSALRGYPSFYPLFPDLRMSHGIKKGVGFTLLVNEGEQEILGTLISPVEGRAEIWNAWNEAISSLSACRVDKKGMHLPLRLKRRESVIVCVDPSQKVHINQQTQTKTTMLLQYELNDGWEAGFIDEKSRMKLKNLESWTSWDGFINYSGTIVYETEFEWREDESVDVWLLDMGEVHEVVHVHVNNMDAGFLLWKPYSLDISKWLRTGVNILTLEITNTRANHFEQAGLKSGLIGPVRLYGCSVQ